MKIQTMRMHEKSDFKQETTQRPGRHATSIRQVGSTLPRTSYDVLMAGNGLQFYISDLCYTGIRVSPLVATKIRKTKSTVNALSHTKLGRTTESKQRK